MTKRKTYTDPVKKMINSEQMRQKRQYIFKRAEEE